jgi:hypothetical protein
MPGRMKKNSYLYLLLILLSLAQQMQAQDSDSLALLKGPTAFTVTKGNLECGLFQPQRIGLTNKLELSCHPILFLIYPNAAVKVQIYKAKELVISSEHSLSCPSPAMKVFQMKGAGGLISSQYSIPLMISMYNGLLISKIISSRAIITINGGFYLSFGSSGLDKTSSIDLPVFYPRLGSLYHQPEILSGLKFNSILSNHLSYLLGAEVYIIPGVKDNLFIEQSGLLQWKPGRKFVFQAGYLLSYGRYPFGTQWNLLPNADIAYLIGSKSK